MLKPTHMIHTLAFSFVLGLSSTTASAADFTLSSSDIQAGKYMPKQQEFQGFGCTGGNSSPTLTWKNPPAGTKSFALTVYDPDAPTGSGWWHWQIVNISKDARQLKANAGNPGQGMAPKGSLQIENDYGQQGFGGACPPKGHGDHRYQYTIHALKVDKLDLNPKASGALVGYMINSNTIDSARLEALYRRD